jgi:hypothetical protein
VGHVLSEVLALQEGRTPAVTEDERDVRAARLQRAALEEVTRLLPDYRGLVLEMWEARGRLYEALHKGAQGDHATPGQFLVRAARTLFAHREVFEGAGPAPSASQPPLALPAPPAGSGGEAALPDVVDLDQIAAFAHLKKDSLKPYKRRNQDPLPPPDFPGGGGKRDFWRWSTIRPWLVRNFPLPFPEHLPSLRPPR